MAENAADGVVMLKPLAPKTRVPRMVPNPANSTAPHYWKQLEISQHMEGLAKQMVKVALIKRPPPVRIANEDMPRSPWDVKNLSRRHETTYITYHREYLREEAKLVKDLKSSFIAGAIDPECNDPDTTICRLAKAYCMKDMAEVLAHQYNVYEGPHVMDASLSMHIAKCALNALMYLHGQASMLHGDVKSFNVLFDGTAGGRVKLCGLGPASFKLGGGQTVQQQQAQGGKPLALGLWSAPELFERGAEALGTASDMWSFGLFLFELLTSYPPHTFPGVMDDALADPQEMEKLRPTAEVILMDDEEEEMEEEEEEMEEEEDEEEDYEALQAINDEEDEIMEQGIVYGPDYAYDEEEEEEEEDEEGGEPRGWRQPLEEEEEEEPRGWRQPSEEGEEEGAEEGEEEEEEEMLCASQKPLEQKLEGKVDGNPRKRSASTDVQQAAAIDGEQNANVAIMPALEEKNEEDVPPDARKKAKVADGDDTTNMPSADTTQTIEKAATEESAGAEEDDKPADVPNGEAALLPSPAVLEEAAPATPTVAMPANAEAAATSAVNEPELIADTPENDGGASARQQPCEEVITVHDSSEEEQDGGRKQRLLHGRRQSVSSEDERILNSMKYHHLYGPDQLYKDEDNCSEPVEDEEFINYVSLGTRPPIPVELKYGPAHQLLLEMFCLCTAKRPEDRPSAELLYRQLIMAEMASVGAAAQLDQRSTDQPPANIQKNQQ